MTCRFVMFAALAVAAGAQAEVSVPLVLEKGIPVATLTIAGQAFPFTFDMGSGRTVHLTRDVMARVPDRFAADGILGGDFFQVYAVYVDLAKRTVALRATGK